jgi:hypothetical protein
MQSNGRLGMLLHYLFMRASSQSLPSNNIYAYGLAGISNIQQAQANNVPLVYG